MGTVLDEVIERILGIKSEEDPVFKVVPFSEDWRSSKYSGYFHVYVAHPTDDQPTKFLKDKKTLTFLTWAEAIAQEGVEIPIEEAKPVGVIRVEGGKYISFDNVNGYYPALLKYHQMLDAAGIMPAELGEKKPERGLEGIIPGREVEVIMPQRDFQLRLF